MFIEERNGSFSTPYLYNGKELDPETGYYYYGARYYNPRVSQWLSVDPLAEKYPSWSPYTYTFNNPIRFIDPTGMEGEDPPGSKNPRKPESRPEGMSEEEGLSYIVVIDGKKYHKYTDNLFAKIGNIINSWFGGDDDYFVEKKPYNRVDDRFIHELVNQSAGALVGGVIAKGVSRAFVATFSNSATKVGVEITDDFFVSATSSSGKQGLTNVGRALQKHVGREGSVFRNTKFSHKTANDDGLKVLNEIINTPKKNMIIQNAKQGGTEIYNKATGQGFAISRTGKFNGFRELK